MSYKQGMDIIGTKGGSGAKPKPPYEAPDTLSNTSYAKLLDLVSEGEIGGLVNGGASIFLDETPLLSAGASNFGGVKWAQRTGTLDQEYIEGFPNAVSEVSINYELKAIQPFVRSINKLELSAISVRMALGIMRSQDPTTGDIGGTSVSWKIEIQTDGGPWITTDTITKTGKSSAVVQVATRVDLPKARTGWQLRVTRLTPDSSSSFLQNSTTIDALTEIVDAKFIYPNSAIIATQFDATAFSGVPKRAFHIKGRIIRVPSNYEPETREYFGTWDGTFKPAWTDNPAWIYYDLLLHPRYGLGDQITASQVDKWELYRIGQYCDQLVPDGKGGQEPRFTCNLFLSDRAPALRVMQDIASIFRGISYWGSGMTYVSADMPKDSDHTYTNAQVKDGVFTYKGAPLESRHNVALVSWNDPNDFFRQKVEYVEDKDGIASYGGINKVEMTAFGCSSQGQAQRAGRWALLTNKLESEMVTFTLPLTGAFVQPGHLCRIADNDLGGRRIGGRILSSTRSSVEVDSVGRVVPGDRVFFMIDGEPVERVVASFDEESRTISLTRQLDKAPERMTPWAIESDDLALTEWNVNAVKDNGDMTFTVTAMRHIRGKFDNVENGTMIEKPPITVIPPSVMPAPQNIKLSSNWSIDQTMAVTTMTIDWDPTPNAIAYEVQWRVNDKDWVYAGRTGTNSFEVEGIYAGRYVARVQAVNALDIYSPWATSAETRLLGKDGEPPLLAFMRTTPLTMGIRLDWGFLPGSTDTLYTQIEYALSPTDENPMHLGEYAYPLNTHTMTGLASGKTFYFRGRLHDRTGNIGQWSDWVRGTSSADADVILDYIQGKIEEGSLGPHLSAEIEKISGDGPGSVNERLEAVKDLISNYTDALVWDETKTYATGEIVRWGQNLYQAIAPVPTGTKPPNSAYWKDVGAILEEANALAGEVHNLTQQITVLGDEVRASSEKVDGVWVQLNPPMAGTEDILAGDTTVMAGVWSVWSAIGEGDYANGKRIDTLQAEVNTNKASIVTMQEVVAKLDEAFATEIVEMQATVAENTAAIRREAEVRQTETSSLSRRSDTLETNLGEASLKAQESLELAQDANGKITGSWSVRFNYDPGNGEYTYAGVGLGIENGPNGLIQSKFIISADLFAIQQAGQTPFAIENGEVYMRSAFIKRGSIGMLQIGDYLQSDDYVEGQTGWRWYANGRMENNGRGDGYRVNQTNKYWRLYVDGLSQPLVELGVLT